MLSLSNIFRQQPLRFQPMASSRFFLQVRGLYRGLTPPLIGGAFETGVNYLVYCRALKFLKADHGMDHLTAVPAAAAFGGVALSFILGPTELIKCRLQARNTIYKGPLDCVQQTIREEGLRGLTRGMGATMAREVPGNALFFYVYEWLRRGLPGRLTMENVPSSSLLDVMKDASSSIVCGGTAGIAMWAAVLPIDVAKTRLQTARPGTPWDVGVLKNMAMVSRWFAVCSSDIIPVQRRGRSTWCCHKKGLC